MGRSEASDWIAFDRLEPGPNAYLHAILSALCCLANSWGAKVKASDFLPVRRPPPRDQSSAEGVALFRALFPQAKVVTRTNG